uniref:SUN domain-containing protein n=1 Tax=Hyaloperonospora arabidopsidis (strain Emoy2) TaxID=559515 RepID=M4BPN2_HYAAE
MRSIKHGLLVLLVLAALASGHSRPRPDTAPKNEVDNDPDHLPIDSVAPQDAKAAQEDEVNAVQTVIATETKLSSRIQQITEPVELKADKKIADEDVDHPLDLPSGLFEVVDADSVDTRTRQNYASLDAGATILDAAPDTKSPTNVLVPDKDRYMLTPCSNARKWVVVSLSEDVSDAEKRTLWVTVVERVSFPLLLCVILLQVHADAIAVANYEKFSSPVKEFIVLGSVNYPTDTWLVLGNFTAEHSNGEQIFQLDAQQHVRYIKFRILSHYGSEYYCTLSQLRVFGRTFTQVISELERSIDAEVEALDAHEASAAPQLPALPASTEVYVPRISDPMELMSQCLLEKNNTVVAVFYDKPQQMEHYRSHGMCCLVDYTPELIEAEAAASLNADEHLLTISHDPAVSDIVDEGRVYVAGPDSSTNESNVSVTHESDIDASTTNGGASLLSATHNTAVSSTQSLGRLENIFCKERADLREWFWRMENHKNSVNDTVKKSSARTMSAGALRANRKAHFGSSWDDSAIERKTLISDLVGDSQRKFRRHHTKRLSQASLDLKRLK